MNALEILFLERLAKLGFKQSQTVVCSVNNMCVEIGINDGYGKMMDGSIISIMTPSQLNDGEYGLATSVCDDIDEIARHWCNAHKKSIIEIGLNNVQNLVHIFTSSYQQWDDESLDILRNEEL
jgi:hypothetical protein